MKKYTYFSLLFCLGIFGCSKKTAPISPVIVECLINIGYKNAVSNDLLDSSQTDFYNFLYMDHFYIDSLGTVQKVRVGGDYPKDMLIVPSASRYYLRVFPYADGSTTGTKHSTDIIQLNADDMDTLKSEVEITPSSVILTKLWYNDSLAYERGVTGNAIIITK